MVVPTRHRAKIGKTEITFSPGSLDPVAAKAVHAAEKAKWRKVFSDLDLERDIDDRARAPKLVADTMRALADRNTLDDVVLALSKFIRIQGRDVVGPLSASHGTRRRRFAPALGRRPSRHNPPAIAHGRSGLTKARLPDQSPVRPSPP
jgi:hypothetical protein